MGLGIGLGESERGIKEGNRAEPRVCTAKARALNTTLTQLSDWKGFFLSLS